MTRSIDPDQVNQVLRSRVRRAYELGRLRAGLLHATYIAVGSGLLGSQWVGVTAWAWAPLTFVLWLGLWWRGGAFLVGAHYGLAAGVLTLALPLSLLRPCCGARDASLSSAAFVCTMPELCVLAGTLVGLPLAFMLLRNRDWPRGALIFGMLLGTLSVAAVKCHLVFAGEALGLLLGVTLGIAAASALAARVRSGKSAA
jgi:hypothetical protein